LLQLRAATKLSKSFDTPNFQNFTLLKFFVNIINVQKVPYQNKNWF